MKKSMLLVILFSLANIFCNENDNLLGKKENEVFVYYYTKEDTDAAKDIKAILDNNYQKICGDLEYQYRYKIQVNIYSDQKTYDENLINKELIGSPAYSGNRRMYLVSPKSPIKIPGIPYEDRLLMAVHEFAHLMADEINDDLPVWLDEGLACYVGSSNMYKYFCRSYIPKLPSITLKDLDENYYKISGADLYSYCAVRYIIEKYGFRKLNQLVRNPEGFEEIFSVSREQFNNEWHLFINKTWNKIDY